MLPSLSAGTFECGRPQIVFERGIGIVVVIEPKLCRKFRVGVPPRGGAYFDFPKVPFFVNAEVCTIHRQQEARQHGKHHSRASLSLGLIAGGELLGHPPAPTSTCDGEGRSAQL